MIQNKLMKNFVRDNQDTFNNIIAAIDEGDIKLAHRIVHTLKSGAGFIGKIKLMEAAQAVESSLKDEKPLFTIEQMNMLEQELNTVLIELSPLLNETSDHIEQLERLKNEEIAVLFEKLTELFDSGDPDCLELINEVRRIPGTEDLIRQMEDFEFESASKILEDIKRNLEENINE